MLNLLRTSRLHPQLSAAAHFHGLVDYNKTAFSPPGRKIIENEKPGKRGTWDLHGQHGYSLGTALHHYPCQNITSQPRPVNASWTLSSSFPTIIKYHSYHPPTYCSWRPNTVRTLYKILIHKSHSLASRMTPYRPLLNWRQFSNSNCTRLRLPRLKLSPHRSSNTHALLNHQIKS
jgi:hypothetical protein